MFNTRHALLPILATHLLSLKLANSCIDRLVKPTFRGIVEREIEAFSHCTALCHLPA
ncbi:hypothetical protein MACH17_01370 [Phaeobacter inhibens]|nr:hypothetical protein MACH17_01370 [Phaeobacter inhibens]